MGIHIKADHTPGIKSGGIGHVRHIVGRYRPYRAQIAAQAKARRQIFPCTGTVPGQDADAEN